ncbi:hypothetical protein KC19_9G100400 [Ceratodon purpureus]|uniref:Uncharacterized protein n=1 Tax=Ceratodon purpureus TaxID=3225 RepID=A0A8T0GYB2_CERPU|nr:hypothetical protein KC19_9G100400 [Ceratodon purpureus]
MRRSLLASFSLGFWQSLLKGLDFVLCGSVVEILRVQSAIAMLSFLVWEIEEYLDLLRSFQSCCHLHSMLKCFCIMKIFAHMDWIWRNTCW